jgi:hypothetical protein
MGVGQYSMALLIFALGIGLGMGIVSDSSIENTKNGLFEQPSELGSAIEKTSTPHTMADLLLKFEQLQSEEVKSENKDRPSPSDWVPMESIKVFENEAIISIEGLQWARYLDTNSMDPVIDSNANTLQIIPKNEQEIQVGDIVAYESKYHEGIITHRVIEIGEDEEGWFAILKGDNNPKADPGNIRFSQIKRVVVAVIY